MKILNLFRQSQKEDLFALGEKRLTQLKAEGRYSCYRNTKATLRKLSCFMQGKKLPLDDVTPDLIAMFESYLALKEGNSRNTIAENIKIISQLLTQHGVRDNPCAVHKVSREQTMRHYLMEEEIERLMALSLSPGSEAAVARDIFFVECRTGLRISDLLQLRWCDYDGKTIRIRMQKTQRLLSIPVGKRVREVLERYRNLFSKDAERVFPAWEMVAVGEKDEFAVSRRLIYATARVNHHIKRLAVRAGVDKPISTHVGRHTFATMLLSKGASIYEIKELLGHQDVKVTQVYAHLMDKRKRELVDMLE